MKKRKEEKQIDSGQEFRSKIFQHENHPKPVTRRDFLAQGMVSLTATVMMPSILGMIMREHEARAAVSCPVPGAVNNAIPTIILDCAGGAALMYSWTPLGVNGSFLPGSAYGTHGTGSTTLVPTTTSAYGAPMNTGSQILAGMKNPLPGGGAATAAALANWRAVTFAANSSSDTGENLANPVGYIAQYGALGSKITTPLGTGYSGSSGGNSKSPFIGSGLKPVRMSSLNDVLAAVSYENTIMALPPNALKAMAAATANLSASQAAKLSQLPNDQQLSTLVQCGFINNKALADNFGGKDTQVDPRPIAACQQVFGITTASSPTDPTVLEATLVYNAIMQYSGPVTFSVGGADYHDNTRTSGDAFDLALGKRLGRIIELAYRLGKKVAVPIITDGGISTGNGSTIWTGDSNGRNLAVLGYYDPAGPRAIQHSMIGAYTTGGVVESSSLNVLGANSTSNGPSLVAKAMFYNYCLLTGHPELWSNAVNGISLNTFNSMNLISAWA